MSPHSDAPASLAAAPGPATAPANRAHGANPVRTARKVRWTVAAQDESVQKWLDAQGDVSRSLWLVVRDAIQRNGYADYAYSPLEKLPRRGRPPRESGSEAEGTEAEDHEGESPDFEDDDNDNARVLDRAQAQVPPGRSAPRAVDPEPEPDPAPVPAPEGGQWDMDAIFANRP